MTVTINKMIVTINRMIVTINRMIVTINRMFLLLSLQILCTDISLSDGLGVCSSQGGDLWIWDTDTGETRVRYY